MHDFPESLCWCHRHWRRKSWCGRAQPLRRLQQILKPRGGITGTEATTAFVSVFGTRSAELDLSCNALTDAVSDRNRHRSRSAVFVGAAPSTVIVKVIEAVDPNEMGSMYQLPRGKTCRVGRDQRAGEVDAVETPFIWLCTGH